MANYTYLGASGANFDSMIQRFGVVTVMNAKVYNSIYKPTDADEKTPENILGLYNGETALCTLDTLKIANVTVEGPTKTVTGGQYSNPLIKFGKTARLEMQDALGNSSALDALCGTVTEYSSTKASYKEAIADTSSDTKRISLNVGNNFVGDKCIIGDSFFIHQGTGEKVPVKIIFYNFLPDSLFNLTQDAEGDATVFDMNGDLETTNVTLHDNEGNPITAGLFYSILESSDFAITVKSASVIFKGMKDGYKAIVRNATSTGDAEITFVNKEATISQLTANKHYDYVITDEKNKHIQHGSFTTLAQ